MARGAKRATKRHDNPCRIYWGSHGCKKARNHGTSHVCNCGDVLDTGNPDIITYGEDSESVRTESDGIR